MIVQLLMYIAASCLSFFIGIFIGMEIEAQSVLNKYDFLNWRVKREYKKNGIISAIKLYRQIHNTCLSESKSSVERIVGYKRIECSIHGVFYKDPKFNSCPYCIDRSVSVI